ncbi:MAG: polysaccharide biosynthesis protein [Gemmatimonadetes bacterium]|nr:polysaccharide biosynthesis protein [Gemmatimonadota bacterium]
MLVSNAFRYSLARGLPGLANFFALALFTRLLGPTGYGSYALVIATVGLAYAVLFQWLSLATLRFAQSQLADRATVLVSVRRWYWRIAAVVVVLVAGVAIVGVPDLPRPTIVLAGVLLLAHAWVEINLMLASADRRPGRYGWLAGVKAGGVLLFGAIGAWSGYGFGGVVAGACVGLVLPAIWAAARDWRGLAAGGVAATEVALGRYGAPLAVTYLLDFIISTSDRLLIGAMLGAAAAGTYAAAYDLTQQSMWTLMMIVNLSAYPLMMTAVERSDAVALGALGRRHIGLLLGIGLPVAAGLAVLAPGISTAAFGSAFAREAATVLPIVAVAILLGGLKSYYFDLAFQAGRSTKGQLIVAAVAGVANLVLNILWIPRFGPTGAAAATLAAYGLGLGLSVVAGRRVVPLPFGGADAGKLLLAATAMLLVLYPFRAGDGLPALAAKIVVGAAVYATICWLTNPAGVRDGIRAWWHSRAAGPPATGWSS